VAADTFVDCTQAARDKMKRILEVARQKGAEMAERLKTTYRDLLEVTPTVVARAKHVQVVLSAQGGAAAERLAGTFE
jgi:hypothetical protein